MGFFFLHINVFNTYVGVYLCKILKHNIWKYMCVYRHVFL